jgi:uncharacterized RDD family membrane protein YckC
MDMAYVQGTTAGAPATGANIHVTGRRVVATIVDSIILGIVNYIVTQIFGTPTEVSGMQLTQLSPAGGVIIFLVAVAYFVLMEGLLGRTVGKYVTGIKIVDQATGAVPGAGKAALRTLLRIVDGLFVYLVGFIVVLSSQRRQRLGDMVAKTQVVRA